MPRIINAFSGTSPIAATIKSLGNAMFGEDAMANAINQEKLYALERENVETDNYGRMIAQGGADGAWTSPVAQAMLFATGRNAGTTQGAYNANQARMRAQAAADLAERARQFNMTPVEAVKGGAPVFVPRSGAFDEGVMPLETLNINERNRHNVAGENLDRDKFIFDQDKFWQEPQAALVNGQPGFTPRAGLTDTGVSPILTDTQVKGTQANANFGNMGALPPAEQDYLGIGSGKTGTPKNYILPGGKSLITYDGVTDAQTGAALPPGGYIGTVEGPAGDVGLTNSVQTDLQSDTISNAKFKSLINMAMPLTGDPSLFGIQGNIRSKAQDVLQSFGGLPVLNGVRQEFLNNVVDSKTKQPLAPDVAAALIPELYDARLSEVETLWGLLVYQGAAALAGQENRSVSDKDVQFMRNILGDPHSLFSSNISMATKLKQAQNVVDSFDQISREALGGGGAVNPVGNAPSPVGNAPTGGAVDWKSYFGGR